MIYLRQKTEPATEKVPQEKLQFPRKKLCTTEIIPFAPQNIYLPPPPETISPPPPNNLNLPGKFYCHLPNYLNHPRLQPSQPNYSN